MVPSLVSPLRLAFVLALFFLALWTMIRLSDGFAPRLPIADGASGQLDELRYVVRGREVMDNVLKTQVLLKILVSGEVSRAGLEKLLAALEKEQSKQTGFRHRSSPTHVAIYAYPSQEHLDSESGWVAMMLRLGAEASPQFTVNQALLAAPKRPKEAKFGLSEETRLRIWQEVVRGEERAWQEAERVYPRPGLKSKIDLTAERARMKKRYEMMLALAKKYEKEVLAKHNLTEEQWRAIRIEAEEKQWPLPRQGP